MKKFSFALLAMFLSILVVPAAQAADVDKAKSFVDDVAGQALNIITKESEEATKQAKLEKLFSSSVDVKWVGQFVLGRYWRTASAAERKDYLKKYEDFLMANYASRFAKYSGGSYTITGAREDGDKEFLIGMQITTPDNTKVMVDYKLRKGGAKGFQIYDIVVEGVSMITTQRSEFAAVLNQGGLSSLIEKLDSKTAKVASAKS